MKPVIDQAIARIRAYRDTMGWGVYELATAAGLSPNACMWMDADDKPWDPRASTLRALEAVVPSDFLIPPDYEPRRIVPQRRGPLASNRNRKAA